LTGLNCLLGALIMAKMTTILATAVVALALGGCASIFREFPVPGDSQAQVTAKFGQPTSVYPEGAGQELEYATGPMGQFTYMAHMGPDGRLVSFEQVLTGEKFALLKIDHATKADVLRVVGRPAERSTLPLRDFEVWSYRYKESGVWNSLMSLMFDRNGVLRMMQNGPDPMYERRDNDRM
jgi:hypothetical protein